MADPGLNQLLKWGVENSEASRTDGTSENDPKAVRDPSRGFNQEMLATLLGGHTDADRMREAMTAILSPD
ncbi:hsp70 nucleotide exchange factor fes1, partial [Cryomyces antarcticus]